MHTPHNNTAIPVNNQGRRMATRQATRLTDPLHRTRHRLRNSLRRVRTADNLAFNNSSSRLLISRRARHRKSRRSWQCSCVPSLTSTKCELTVAEQGAAGSVMLLREHCSSVNAAHDSFSMFPVGKRHATVCEARQKVFVVTSGRIRSAKSVHYREKERDRREAEKMSIDVIVV